MKNPSVEAKVKVMDRLKALKLVNEIQNEKSLNGYNVLEFINNGKSAAVFKAKKNDMFYALKIFDNDLIERFGHEIQIKRIEQEILLKGHKIKNLVKIFDAGSTFLGSQNYYYIVMELILGMNLKEYIQSKSFNHSFIIKVLEKLYNTTEQLLIEKHIVHRDIKPENIMVDTQEEITLMDLGVLKLLGVKSFSDEEEKLFVGTLRYAAPEFIMRKEDDSIQGWRAVNTYQIGATLHDLIMKKELFHDKSPYPNLVIAIKDDIPHITNNEYPFDLLQLIRDMLTKDWKTRIKLVTHNRIKKVIALQNTNENIVEKKFDELLKLRLSHQAKFDEIENLKRSKIELKERQKTVHNNLVKTIDFCFEIIKSRGVFNSLEKSNAFVLNHYMNNKELLVKNYLYKLIGELKLGFPSSLFILVKILNDENNYSEIDIWAIFPLNILEEIKVQRPVDLFKKLTNGRDKRNKYQSYQNQAYQTYNFIKTINIYKGIVEFDESFNEHITEKLISLITKAIKSAKNIVDEEISFKESVIKTNNRVTTRILSNRHNIILDQKV